MHKNRTLAAAHADTPATPATPALAYRAATVTSFAGSRCVLDIDGSAVHAEVAPHLLALKAGQRVAVLDGGAQAPCLVIAAWPGAQATPDAPLSFDPATGTLHIQAARLNLSALATVELHCGEARIRLTLDGKAHIEGAEILSAAIGANRIEGASIDLN